MNQYSRFVLGFLLLISSSVARGQSNYSWSTGTSGDWGSSSWTLSGVKNSGPPQSTDNATISVGGVNNVPYQVTVSDSRTINNVTLSNSQATLSIASTGSLTVNGYFALNGGDLDNTSGGLTLNGQLNWGGGNVTGGTVTASSGGTITGSGTISGATTTLNFNAGTWSWSGGNLILSGGGTWTIGSGATVNLTADVNFSGSSVNGIVNNAGTFQKTGGTGTSLIAGGITFNNSGTLSVSSGTLDLQGTANNTGIINIASGRQFFVDTGGLLNLNSGSSLTGTGLLNLNSHTAGISVNSAVTVAGDVSVVRGTFGGTGSIAIAGALNLVAYDSNTAIATTVYANGGGNWTGGGTAYIGTGSVNVNGGTVVWGGNSIKFTDSGFLTIGASGTLNLQDNQSILVTAGSPTVIISGLFEKTAGTSSATIPSSVNLTVASGGTIDSQSGTIILQPSTISNSGTILASTGTIEFNSPITLTGSGTLQTNTTGSLTVTPNSGNTVLLSTGTLNNSGTLNINSGTFSIASAAAIANYIAANTTLTGGVWNVTNSTLNLNGRTISTIAAGTTVELSGSTANITGLTNLTQVNGYLRVYNSATLTPTSTVTNNGTIEVSGTFGSAMIVSNTGVLTGFGTVSGAVTIQSGGVISPGPGPYNATGTKVLTTGQLVLNGGSQYTWELNSWASNASAGTNFDQ